MSNFKKGEEVRVVNGSGSYSGKFAGCYGIVGTESSRRVRVLLYGQPRNPNSSYVYYWFDPTELVSVEDFSEKDNTIKERGEENNMQKENVIKTEPFTREIIDLWHQKKLNKMKKKNESKIKMLVQGDEAVEYINGMMEEMKECLCNYDLNIEGAQDSIKLSNLDILITRETNELLKKCDNKYRKKAANLSDRYNEIKTMLMPCEDYWQEMNILQGYEVIDSDLKLLI